MPARDPDQQLFPTSFRCPPRTYRAIMRHARDQGCSISFKIVQILEEWLAKQPHERDRPSPTRMHLDPPRGGQDR